MNNRNGLVFNFVLLIMCCFLFAEIILKVKKFGNILCNYVAIAIICDL